MEHTHMKQYSSSCDAIINQIKSCKPKKITALNTYYRQSNSEQYLGIRLG